MQHIHAFTRPRWNGMGYTHHCRCGTPRPEEPVSYPVSYRDNDFVRFALIMLRRAGGEIRLSDTEIVDATMVEDGYLVEAHRDEQSFETVLRMRKKPAEECGRCRGERDEHTPATERNARNWPRCANCAARDRAEDDEADRRLRTQHNGRCGALGPDLGGDARMLCYLRGGHLGMHETQDGISFTNGGMVHLNSTATTHSDETRR